MHPFPRAQKPHEGGGNRALFFALGFCVILGRVEEVGSPRKKNERFLRAWFIQNDRRNR
jgi:hypothetical protein